MAKTKAEYIIDGRAAISTGAANPQKPGSWQHAAFELGYNAEKQRIADQASLPTFNLPAVDCSYWPKGAQEHAFQLWQQLGQETTEKRATRLVRSLHRVVNRHSVRPLTDVRNGNKSWARDLMTKSTHS